MHAFLTHMRAKPGQRDEVIRLTTIMLEQTQSEDGIPVYVFSTAQDSPDDFYFYDIYESEEARKAHESTDKFRLGHVKLILDGSIQGFTARLRPPGYLGDRPNGLWLIPPGQVADLLRPFHAGGLTVHAHCNGDEAVDVFLDALGDIDAAVEEAMPSPSSFASGDGDGGFSSGASSGGLSASAIRGLPTRTYRARTDGGSADEPPHCAVCLCDAEEGEEIKTLPCAHRFHAKCVDRWLRGHRSCPMCKSDVGAMSARALAARDEAPEATRYRRAPTSRRSGAVASAR